MNRPPKNSNRISDSRSDASTSSKLPDRLSAALPDHLLERSRAICVAPQDSGSTRSRGAVVYWTHHALRTDENPALDVARRFAVALQRPLVVYQGLSSNYRYASDRHHVFQLQAAAELQREYEELQIRYAFHLQTRNNPTPALLGIAQQTDLLVTEDFPGEPTDRWIQRLSYLKDLTIVAVDTACVVPMQLVGKAYDRAFAFRDATKNMYRARIGRAWPKSEERPAFFEGALPFEPVDLSQQDPLRLVSQCDIDTMVAPVSDTVGGSRAGYQRWEEFLRGRISRYASKRNDPCSDVSSRMSAYLHYGMVSPMRLARQADERNAEKYLDELLIWRELAYGYCFYRSDYRSLSTLPRWAVETLHKHQKDPRDRLYSWESLARGQTDDPLWNACQHSLFKHGELHNNVRMTWGKSLLQWTDSPERALEWLIDLNHRYALDGRDPASYGGILWCLGQFDRPFFPEQPVLGTVRSRTTSEHLGRLDLEKYQSKVHRPIAGRPCKVAVLGAGIAGSLCARTLSDVGFEVEVYEKSRGAGGRAATRRLDSGGILDHGAPFFEVPSKRWDLLLESWEQDGVISKWNPRIGKWSDSAQTPPIVSCKAGLSNLWVGRGGMNQLGKHLAKGLKVIYRTAIEGLERRQDGWFLRGKVTDSNGEATDIQSGPYDTVVVALPAPQAAAIVDSSCHWKPIAERQQMEPIWAAMVEFENAWQIPWDAIAFDNHPCLGWISRQSSKPNGSGNSKPERRLDAWSIHATAAWSKRSIESSSEEVGQHLHESLLTLGLGEIPKIVSLQSHRWRYAQARVGDGQTRGESYLWDEDQQCGACGDWIAPLGAVGPLGRAPGIAGALESGAAMASCVIRHWLGRYPVSNAGQGGARAFQPMLFGEEAF